MHVYAQQNDCTHGRGNSVSFDNRVFFDRSTPVCVVHNLTRKRRVNLVTSESYSVTTNQHLSGLTRSLMSHGVTIRVPSIGATGGRHRATQPEYNGKPDHKRNLAYFVSEYESSVRSARKAVTYWEHHVRALREVTETCTTYCTLFKLKVPARLTPDADTAHEAARRDEMSKRAADPKQAEKNERARVRRELKWLHERGQRAYGLNWRERQKFNAILRDYMDDAQIRACMAREETVFGIENDRRAYSPNVSLAEWSRAIASLTDEQNALAEVRRQQWFGEYDRRVKEQRETARVAREAREVANRDAWLAGTGVAYGWSGVVDGGALLRVHPSDANIVQTSRGAEVPRGEAYALYQYIVRVRAANDGGAPITEAPSGWRRVGHFVVSSIEADYTLHIGCHIIKWNEVERFAQSIGW
jgi:hypothetical protein